MEEKEVGYVSKKSFIFLTALGFFILSLALEYTKLSVSMGRELQLMRYVAYALCIVKILMEAVYRKRETLWYAAILLFAGMESMVSGNREMFFLLFFLLAAYGVDLRQAFKVQISIQLACLLAVWALCAVGLIENIEFFSHGVVRYSMGFTYVGLPGTLFFAIQVSWLYLRNQKVTWVETLVCLIMWIVIYHFTDTRTSALLGVIMTVVCYVAKYCTKVMKWKIMKVFCICYYPFVMICVWILQYFYNTNHTSVAMQKLDSGLSGRLELNRLALEQYELKLLGSDITWVSNVENRVRNDYNYVDSTYFRVLFDFVLVIGILFLLINVYIMYEMWKKEHLIGCIIMCIFAAMAFMMPITGLHTNPLLLLAGGIFHAKTKVCQT